MNDYQTKRRYRQQKLTKQGFYELRQQRSRARRRAEACKNQGLPSLQQIAHPDNLIKVFEELQRNAGHAPGPDRIAYDQLSRREIGQIMRSLSKEILNGTYEPSKARHIKILKSDGVRYRILKIRSITYRVVATALANAMGPFWELKFLSGSHGFRSGRGVSSFLIDMERIIIDQQRYVIVQDDIANAFDNVQIGSVMGQHHQYITDSPLLNLIHTVLRGHHTERRTIGIDQGSAYSPLALNVVLHHTLDQPFSDNAVHPPWLRYADNLVYLARSVSEGLTAIQDSKNLLSRVGMTLKGTDGPPVDLSQRGAKAMILGLSIQLVNNQIQYDLTEDVWTNLKQRLSETHTTTGAIQAIQGWIDSCAPAFEGKPERPVINRILRVLAEDGYRELPHHQLQRYLQSARDRWKTRKAHTQKVFKDKKDSGQQDAAAPLARIDRASRMPEAGVEGEALSDPGSCVLAQGGRAVASYAGC